VVGSLQFSFLLAIQPSDGCIANRLLMPESVALLPNTDFGSKLNDQTGRWSPSPYSVTNPTDVTLARLSGNLSAQQVRTVLREGQGHCIDCETKVQGPGGGGGSITMVVPIRNKQVLYRSIVLILSFLPRLEAHSTIPMSMVFTLYIYYSPFYWVAIEDRHHAVIQGVIQGANTA
jgi:hypothetical protein